MSMEVSSGGLAPPGAAEAPRAVPSRAGTLSHPANWRRAASHVASVVAPVALPLLLLGLVASAWEAMAVALHSPLVPHLPEIGKELARIFRGGHFFGEMAVTLLRVGAGFTIAFAVAVAAGIAMGRQKTVAHFLEPAIIVGLTVPGLVWALLCVIWFGIGLTGAAVAVALSIAPALLLNILQGVRAVDAELLEVAAMLRLPLRKRLACLWLPSLMPALLGGARLGLSLAWKVVVLVELFGLSSGIGYQLNSEFGAQNVAGVIAWTLGFAAVMGVLEYGVLAQLEHHLMRWRRTAQV
ncbi:UNVERIFIED_ORG: NitT/TauT family transport system permease protein [Xanthobacter viscosus]|nr:ABC transporter permease subunit [Xanthobacter autotrophicus]